MIILLKLVPALAAISTASLAEISYRTRRNEADYKTSLVKIYITSILSVLLFGCLQVFLGDMRRFVNVTFMTAFMQVLNGLDTKDISRWPIVAVSVLLSYNNW